MSAPAFNHHAVRAIYGFEMKRTWRTLMQSIVSPVLTTSLYFVVFGAALSGQMGSMNGLSRGEFMVPGLIMLSVLTQSVSNASFGIYFPKFTGTIYELHSAPISALEIVLGFVGAAATKSIILAFITLLTAAFLVSLDVKHPVEMVLILFLIAFTFSLFGFIIGIWAENFEQLQFIPMLVLTPLTFLGGTFYQIKELPQLWQNIALFNPVVYLISGFRWSFFGDELADVSIGLSLGMMVLFLGFCVAGVWWIFKTGYRLKS